MRVNHRPGKGFRNAAHKFIRSHKYFRRVLIVTFICPLLLFLMILNAGVEATCVFTDEMRDQLSDWRDEMKKSW